MVPDDRSEQPKEVIVVSSGSIEHRTVNGADTISKRSELQIDIWILNDEGLERGIAKLKINGDYDRLGEGDYEVSSDNADDRSLDGGVSALAIERNDTDTLVTTSTHGHHMDKGANTNGDKGSDLLDEPEASHISRAASIPARIPHDANEQDIHIPSQTL